MQRTGLRASKIVFLLGTLALSSACFVSRPDIIQVGPWFTPKSPDAVELFSSRDETSKPWAGIAIIHSSKFPQNDERSIAKTKKQARVMAAEIGADGLILTEETVTGGFQLGAYQEPEVYISALAFKYAADISTAAAK